MFSVGLITLIAAGSMAAVGWSTSSSLLSGEIRTRVDAIAEVREEHLSLYVDNTFTALQLIASRIILQRFVSKIFFENKPLAAEELVLAHQDISNSIASYRGVYVAEILAVNGTSIVRAEKPGVEGFFDDEKPTMSPAMSRTGISGTEVSFPYPVRVKSENPDHTGEAFVFSINMVHQERGVKMGTLRLLISTDELFGILSGRAGLIGTRGQVLLVQQSGPWGETFRFIIPPAHDPPPQPEVPTHDYECLKDATRSSPDDPTVVHTCLSYNGIAVEAASQAVHTVPSWILIAELPTFVVSEPIATLRNKLLVGIFLCLAFALVIAALWSHRAVAPLRKLRQAAEAFSRGDFSARAVPRKRRRFCGSGRSWLVGHTGLRRWRRFWSEGDEIGELNLAFNRMAVDLEELYRNLEEKVLERTKALELANSAKSSFLASISHEIRTPMNGVIGLATILSETSMNPEQLDMVQSIQNCGEALLTIVNDVLDFSKIEAGKLTLEFRPVDMRRIIQTCTFLLQGQANAKGIKLVTEIQENVPELVMTDSVRLQQILLNLIGNAVKFTAKGSVTTRVSRVQGVLRFEVEDTGIGIPADAIGRLFVSFSQVDSTVTRKYGGTGLGLAISRSLVELFGGSLDVKSIEGQGSTFFFELPLVHVVNCEGEGEGESESKGVGNVELGELGKINENAELGENAKLGELAELAELDKLDANVRSPQDVQFDELAQGGHGISEDPLMHTPHTPHARILLAEDNPINVKVVLAHLKKLNFTDVDVVQNGLLATQAVREKEYDVVLMDFQMPIMGGVEATQIIRGDDSIRQPVIIALTANAMEGAAEHCMRMGMDDYLSKPIARETLRTCLARHSPYKRPATE